MENALIGGAIVRKINHSIFTRLPLKPFHSNTLCARPPTPPPAIYHCNSDLEPIKVNSPLFIIANKMAIQMAFSVSPNCSSVWVLQYLCICGVSQKGFVCFIPRIQDYTSIV